MAGKRRIRNVAQLTVLAVVLVASVLGLAELSVRAVYAYAAWRTEKAPLIYERVYWAVPPWVERTSVLYDDPELGLWTLPRSTRTYVNLFGPIGDVADVGELFGALLPELPAWAERRPVWVLETNSQGLRGRELPATKASDAFRVVVLGDSWTVGVNVPVEETYVALLETALGEPLRPRRPKVLNFGVIGGKAETGRRLLPRVLALDADLVVVAYAQNDEAATRDTRPRPPSHALRPLRRRDVLARSELYRLYRWWRTPGEDRIEAALRHELTRPSAVPANEPGRPCPNPDHASSVYATTMDEIVTTLAGAGVRTVLLYDSVPDFASHCTWHALVSLAEKHDVTLVDAATILERRGAELDAENERRLGLVPEHGRRTTGPEAAGVVLRVDMSSDPSGRRPFVVGNHPALGSFAPNVVPLLDDGTSGDQRAGDGVWSRLVIVQAPQILTYAFTNGTTPNTWTGLENYRLRAIEVRPEDFGRTAYPPVARFGEHRLRSDPSHPDAAGHRAIAEALAAAIRSDLARAPAPRTRRDHGAQPSSSPAHNASRNVAAGITVTLPARRTRGTRLTQMKRSTLRSSASARSDLSSRSETFSFAFTSIAVWSPSRKSTS